MIFIGVDPGKKGGYAVIFEKEDVAMAYPWSDEGFVAAMGASATRGEKCVAVVEKVGAMPGQGVTSMFSFGKSAGYIEGVLAALEIPYQLVSPRTWKKAFGLDGSKQKSIEVCKRLFPDVPLLPTDRCRVEADGMAEALLMAEYARRVMR